MPSRVEAMVMAAVPRKAPAGAIDVFRVYWRYSLVSLPALAVGC